ncbi:MAG: crossover junction endodeoxyribonuclease RuvC [Microgenomates group bacterium]
MIAESPEVVIGIDPGFDRLGWAVGTIFGKTIKVLGVGCITPGVSRDHFSRLSELQSSFSKIISQYNPRVAAIETLFFSKNRSSALAVSEARGVLLGRLLATNCEIFEYNPNTIKATVTGSGRATKDLILKMVKLQTGMTLEGQNDDAVDAVAILLTHAILSGTRHLA